MPHFRFCRKKGIEAVTMNEIANACSIGIATLYRHYNTKAELVLAVSARIWDDFMKKNDERRYVSSQTGAEKFDYYSDINTKKSCICRRRCW